MAKGSVRKKGKKWYYRFYVEDASGKMVQKEYAGTESKSQRQRKFLRKALEDYEAKKFVAKADNLTVGRTSGYVGRRRTENGNTQQWYSGKLSGSESVIKNTRSETEN